MLQARCSKEFTAIYPDQIGSLLFQHQFFEPGEHDALHQAIARTKVKCIQQTFFVPDRNTVQWIHDCYFVTESLQCLCTMSGGSAFMVFTKINDMHSFLSR